WSAPGTHAPGLIPRRSPPDPVDGFISWLPLRRLPPPQRAGGTTMLNKITMGSVRLVERWLPDPFIFVLLLTVLVFLAGMGFEAQTPIAMIGHWGDGFWSLLSFSMQMI